MKKIICRWFHRDHWYISKKEYGQVECYKCGRKGSFWTM